MTERSRHVDAIRLLFLLIAGSERIPADSQGTVAVFDGGLRLQAMDFWTRYPDYLADELLDLYEQTKDASLLGQVQKIFDEEEPSIRHLSMIRYRFGAYEPIDDAVSILKSRGLVDLSGRKSGTQILETKFLIKAPAFDFAKTITSEFPLLEWYESRAALVARLAGNRGGSALKDIQYKKIEYAETQLGGAIPRVAARVEIRLSQLRVAV